MATREIIDIFEQATKANRLDVCRQGNIIHIEAPGTVIMTGDLHGHERNFEKIVNYAQLESNPDTHLILHEIIHSSRSETPGQCHSYRLVCKAAELKAQFPNQVHYLMGNHAMAQAARDEVLKNGQAMVRALNEGLHATFGSNATHVQQFLNDFILSMPLAVRTENRIWMSHTLPSKRHLKTFDNSVLQKTLTFEDLNFNESLRALIWDRHHPEDCLSQLMELWDVDNFIIGHQPQEHGCSMPQRNQIILASDHNHGCFLPFDLSTEYMASDLFNRIIPLAAIM